jgi:hypothetical protein
MRKLVSSLAVMALALGMFLGVASSASASHGVPHTFTGCTLAGGTNGNSKAMEKNKNCQPSGVPQN